MARKKGQSAKRAVTILDIAREASVSPSTVSRVLTGTTYVDPEKQAAVQEAIARLKYRPNLVAQGLVRGRSNTIGVLTQNMNSLFYAELLTGVDQRLNGSGYHPVFANGNWELSRELESLDVLINRRVDALIILGGQIPDERLREVAAAPLPLVIVGRIVEGLEPYCLQIDNFRAAYEATKYLIDAGHTQIAHITGILSHADANDRYRGYCQALADAGLTLNQQLVVQGDFQEPAGIMAVEMLLARGVLFSAIFAANDPMAYGARLALFRRNIRVPDEVSLVGFDDLASSNYCIPPLTTVRQPAFEMGIVAGDMVLKLIEGQQVELPTMQTELIVRESTRMIWQNRPASALRQL
jgi:LacI family transcriptional regulator